jgi:hypothetical protein
MSIEAKNRIDSYDGLLVTSSIIYSLYAVSVDRHSILKDSPPDSYAHSQFFFRLITTSRGKSTKSQWKKKKMSINLCAQQYSRHFLGIISVSFYRQYYFFSTWVDTYRVSYEDRFNLTLFFLAKLKRSIESALVIKHTHELIEAQWMKCVCI